ncbi:MAG: glycosyltransferase family 2 protein [Cyanobacteriota bacterium]
MTRVPSPASPPPLNPDTEGVVVITVAHHSGGVLPALAADLARQVPPPALWLVVDNSPRSTPVEAHTLGAALPLQVLRGEEGEGFGAGCNRALAWLEGQGWPGWAWLLNPDTALPGGEELGRLGEALAGVDPRSLVGTAVEDGQGGLEASGGWFTPGLRFRSRRLDSRQPGIPGAGPAEPLRLDWLSGCSLALRPRAHTPAARFDPAFPLYYEDMDLCLRLGRQGAPVLWLPEPRVIHRRGQGSGSPSPRRWRLSTVSYLRFLRRHCPARVVWLRSARLLAVTAARLPLQPRRSGAVLAGALEAWGLAPRQGGSPEP